MKTKDIFASMALASIATLGCGSQAQTGEEDSGVLVQAADYASGVYSARVRSSSVVLNCYGGAFVRVEVRANPLEVYDGSVTSNVASVFVPTEAYNTLVSVAYRVRLLTLSTDDEDGRVTRFDFGID